MKQAYKSDRKREIDRNNARGKSEILSEEKLSRLPVALQDHFRKCGFVNKPLAMNADIIWKESFIKLKPGQDWKSLQTSQFNSVLPIMRTAYMKVNKMFFAGKDMYLDGKGTMKGKILGLFRIINAQGKEVSQSALITSFCEMMLLSGYAFQDYISWQEIGKHKVKARLRDKDIDVEGVFHFSEDGLFSFFESEDRFYDLGKGRYEKKKFMARVHKYKRIDGIYQPEEVSVSWMLEGREYAYFKGIIERIQSNVEE